jgi:hypothetical protein
MFDASALVPTRAIRVTDVVESKSERVFRYSFSIFKGEILGTQRASRALADAEKALAETVAYARAGGPALAKLLARVEGARDAIAAARAQGGDAAVHRLEGLHT